MPSALTIKAAIIIFLTLFLLIPLEWVSSVISDRIHYQREARNSIAQSWTGPQQFVGPMIVLPYQELHTTTTKAGEQVTQRLQRHQLLLPQDVTIASVVKTEIRRRGIFEVPVYRTELTVEGHFSRRALAQMAARTEAVERWESPFLTALVSDIRGLASRPDLMLGEQSLPFASGPSPLSGDGSLFQSAGMHVVLTALTPQAAAGHEMSDFNGSASGAEDRLPFRFQLQLRGMEQLHFATVADTMQLEMRADWPDPMFSGHFLPDSYTLDAEGFNATWLTSTFSSNARQYLSECVQSRCSGLFSETFGLTLLQPVDHYQQSTRSVKYGILFIVLTFASALLFEVLSRRRLHPVQYTLVGLALALFYLLLVALSEHLAFASAYAVAAAAITLLVMLYASAITGKRAVGVGFGAGIGALYGVMYVILSSEGTALLMGSLLLFLVLATIMWLTRHINWYELESKVVVPRPAGAEPASATSGQ